MITPHALVVASRDQIACNLDGGTAILHLGSGTYYELNETGTFVWESLRHPARVAELHAALLRRYDVTPDQCARDLWALLEAVAAEGLIEVSDGSAP